MTCKFRGLFYRYNGAMNEQVNDVMGAPVPEQTPTPNPGRFRKGDPRINRDGRPRLIWAECEDRAPRADHLMRLVMPGRDLTFRLSRQDAPWIINLPADVEVVDCRVDAARAATVLVIRSETFPRIAKGAPIPEFKPEFNGLRWRRR